MSAAGPFPAVCFYQAYDRDYPRAEALWEGLAAHGVPLVDARANRRNPLRRYPLGLWRFLRGVRRSDVVLANFRSFEQLWLLAVLTRKPIVYDAHISFWQSACEERGWFGPRSPFGRLLFFLDRWNCRRADRVLIDTEAHRDYFVYTFGVPREKLTVVYVSCESRLGPPSPLRRRAPGEPARLFWVGSGIPLQGLDVLYDALLELARRGVPVTTRLVVGDRRPRERLAARAAADGLALTVLGPQPRARVGEEIAAADIGLGGHYSTIPKAKNVIAGKVFELLAMGRPAVVGASPATRELLVDGESAVFCEMGSAASLADAVERLVADPELAERVARGGQELFQARLRPEVAVQPLLAVLARLDR